MALILRTCIALIALLAGAGLSYLYMEKAPQYRIESLDRVIDASAIKVHSALYGGQTLNDQLRSALSLSDTRLENVPSSRFKLHVFDPPVPVPDPTKERDLYRWFVIEDWCNTVPTWTPNYAASQFRVSSQYWTLLTGLDPSYDVDLASNEIVGLSKRLYALEKQRLDVSRAVERGELKRDEAVAANARLDSERDEIISRYREEASRLKQPSSSAASALFDYRNEGFKEVVVDPSGGAWESRACSTDPPLDKWLADAARLESTVVAFGDARLTARIVADASGPRSIVEVQSASIWWGEREPTLESGKASTNSSKVTLSAKKIGVFKFRRPNWFDPGLVAARYRGPWRAGFEPAFRGSDGTLGLLPYAVVVLYSPKVELQLNAADYERYREVSETAGSVRLGPVAFPLRRTAEQEQLPRPDDGLRNVYLASDSALAVALISEVMPPPKGARATFSAKAAR